MPCKTLRHASKEFLQIHPIVESRYFVPVAVEQKCLSRFVFTDPAFARLRPSRMIDRRVHVRKEPIFVWGRKVPGRRGFTFRQRYLSDGFDAFEPVLPWHDQPDGGTVLVRNRFAV